ncbi:hypothetical protein AGMMS49921_02700 [Endomicrobiia bacterium]|nr:hypothetical protein AGMMS49921_02700 [Endomicrobiia bacterium]
MGLFGDGMGAGVGVVGIDVAGKSDNFEGVGEGNEDGALGNFFGELVELINMLF